MLRRFSLLLSLLLLFLPAGHCEEDTVPPLSIDEIADLTARIVSLAKSETPLRSPEGEGDMTEDGYAFSYDFGTLYLNHPLMDEGATLLEYTITGEDLMACRDTFVGESLQALLASFTSENPSLTGDSFHSVLYLYDELPESAAWGWIARDGQRVQSVQYSLHVPMGDGQYSDTGLLYTLEDGFVDSIRVFGLTRRLTLEDVQSTLSLVAQSAMDSSYRAVPTSADGSRVAPFCEDDLVFSGLDFLHTVPEEASDLLGSPIEDSVMEDSDGSTLRMVDYGVCEIFYRVSGGQESTITSVTVGQDGLEGPRAIRVGDTFSSVLSRFRFGEGEATEYQEILYGSPEEDNYAFCEYGQDASATLRYFTVTSSGEKVELMAIFENMVLTEFLVLRV